MTDDLSKRYSKVTIVAQSQGTNNVWGDAVNTKGEAEDEDFPFYKPFTAAEDNSLNPNKQAELTLNRQRHEGFKLQYKVAGHSYQGDNWAINELCRVKDEILGLDDVYLITGRTFEMDKKNGAHTTIRLSKPGLVI